MANGSEVTIKAVIPHPTDTEGLAISDEQIVKLSRPPLCVLVEPQEEKKWTKEYIEGEPSDHRANTSS